MSKRDPALLINDMLESAAKIQSYTIGMDYESFCADGKTVDAVVRNFEIIGEAAGRLPDEFKDAHPDIDWHRLRGFRNRIVHHYFGIDLGIIWQIKEVYLSELIQQLERTSS
ncbi:MAG: DUF86 domain-containing protein [Proteobacteria bacterium]|nr:MAG: DUF86 domain-containing protein [Pseudomonadota bacterium]